jgi:hypothetical protein
MWTTRMTRVAISAVAVLAVTVGFVGGARAEVIEHLTVKGNSVLVSFDQLTPNTCADGTEGTVETFVSLSAFSQATRSRQMPDTDTNTIVAVASRSDSCTGNFLVGSTTVDQAFRQDGLQQATFNRTFGLTDLDGNVVMKLAVHLTLDGTGRVTVNTFNDRFTMDSPDGPVLVIEHSVGRSRDVIVSGSVKLDGDEVIDAFSAGALQEVRSGTIEIQR